MVKLKYYDIAICYKFSNKSIKLYFVVYDHAFAFPSIYVFLTLYLGSKRRSWNSSLKRVGGKCSWAKWVNWVRGQEGGKCEGFSVSQWPLHNSILQGGNDLVPPGLSSRDSSFSLSLTLTLTLGVVSYTSFLLLNPRVLLGMKNCTMYEIQCGKIYLFIFFFVLITLDFLFIFKLFYYFCQDIFFVFVFNLWSKGFFFFFHVFLWRVRMNARGKYYVCRSKHKPKIEIAKRAIIFWQFRAFYRLNDQSKAIFA